MHPQRSLMNALSQEKTVNLARAENGGLELSGTQFFSAFSQFIDCPDLPVKFQVLSSDDAPLSKEVNTTAAELAGTQSFSLSYAENTREKCKELTNLKLSVRGKYQVNC